MAAAEAILDDDDGVDQLIGGPLAEYAARLLRIRLKTGGPLQPLIFSRSQVYTNKRLDDQKAKLGKVRALILKGRQTYTSTLISARFFRHQHCTPGISVYILSHEAESTTHLFNIAKTFYDYLPARYAPTLGKSSSRHMSFPAMGCQYRVGTAGKKETGRSQTVQLFHGSETCFWPNAEEHLAGVLQTVPNVAGTEIIFESTANGIGGEFHSMWQAAERGEGEYQAIFFPWFWNEEYRIEPPRGWTPEDEEREYQDLYDLDPPQAFWYHLKNIELKGTPGKIFWRTKQEYPANPEEAFQAGGVGGYIRSQIIMKARKARFSDAAVSYAPRILGVDVARNITDGDRTKILDRQGRRIGQLVNETIMSDDTYKIAGRVAHHITEFSIDMTFIDVGGVGAGVYDVLRNTGFEDRITPINFGQEALNAERYKNKRAEMWGEFKAWLEDPGGAQVPDTDVFHRHVAGPKADWDANQRLRLEPKEAIKKRLKFSPDEGDAAALTFAFPVSAVSEMTASWRERMALQEMQTTSWMGT